MASPLNILKSVLDLNKNCMHVTDFEEKRVTIQRFGETYEQTRIYVHARPYKRVQCLCPECRKKCPGYDIKYKGESTWPYIPTFADKRSIHGRTTAAYFSDKLAPSTMMQSRISLGQTATP